jgi:hypothetical protein
VADIVTIEIPAVPESIDEQIAGYDSRTERVVVRAMINNYLSSPLEAGTLEIPAARSILPSAAKHS